MGMLLNNDTLQVNFIEDSVKIVVHSPFITSASVVILISPSRSLEVSQHINHITSKEITINEVGLFGAPSLGVESKISISSTE